MLHPRRAVHLARWRGEPPEIRAAELAAAGNHVLYRRLDLLGDTEHLRLLRTTETGERDPARSGHASAHAASPTQRDEDQER